MFCHVPPGHAPFRRPRQRSVCPNPACRSSIAFRSVRAAAGLRAARPFFARIACAHAPAFAPALFARLIARAWTNAGRTSPVRSVGFFRTGARQETKRLPDAASSCLILPRFYKGQALTGNYFIIHERIAAVDRGPDAPVRAQFDPDESTGDGRIAAGLVSRSSPRTAIRGPAPTVSAWREGRKMAPGSPLRSGRGDECGFGPKCDPSRKDSALDRKPTVLRCEPRLNRRPGPLARISHQGHGLRGAVGPAANRMRGRRLSTERQSIQPDRIVLQPRSQKTIFAAPIMRIVRLSWTSSTTPPGSSGGASTPSSPRMAAPVQRATSTISRTTLL